MSSIDPSSPILSGPHGIQVSTNRTATSHLALAPVFAGAAGLLIAASASANLLTNGGFEGTNFEGTYQFLYQGDEIDGWSLTPDGLQEPSYRFKNGHGSDTRFAYQGEMAIMLNSGDSLAQSFGTTVGQTYTLTFAATNIEGAAFAIEVGGAQQVVSLEEGTITKSMADTRFDGHFWRLFQLEFTASDAVTTINFSTSADNGSGWYLDAVAIDAVPAPSALALLGFAGVAGARRRR
jgi:hypothetical protein